MYVYPIQVSVQAACRHESKQTPFFVPSEHEKSSTDNPHTFSADIAVIMSLFFCCNCIGVALGNSVAGAIWNELLPTRLASTLGDLSAARSAFGGLFTYAALCPLGTPQRDAMAESYAYVQRTLCLVGIGTGVMQVMLSLFLSDPKLGNERNLVDGD